MARLILRISTLEPEPGLLVAFLVEVMEQVRTRSGRKLRGEIVQLSKEGQQIRLGTASGNGSDCTLQLQEAVQ